MSHNCWHPTLEQCGFILKNQEVVFIGNLSRNPEVSFEISEKDIEKIGLENIECFWHSHPSNNLNLSLDDYAAFLKYPDHKHRIYSQTSFAEYYVRRGFVMRVENDFTIP